jgi:mxaD protein
MVKVESRRTLEASPEEAWETIGDFQALHEWHPGVVDSTASEGGAVRTIVLADEMGTIVETLTDEGDLRHSYRVDDGPLPISNHSATLMVSAAGDGSEVVWTTEFEVEGMDEDEAAAILKGFFDGGLASLEG